MCKHLTEVPAGKLALHASMTSSIQVQIAVATVSPVILAKGWSSPNQSIGLSLGLPAPPSVGNPYCGLAQGEYIYIYIYILCIDIDDMRPRIAAQAQAQTQAQTQAHCP